MSYDYQKRFICPRLLDYILIVGTHHPNRNNSVAQTPELLRRYPREDHSDFPLPPDVVFFCQPEGCFSVGPKRLTLRECTCFVFTLTDKDSGKSRYGICMNFFRSFEKRYERSRVDSGPYSMGKNVAGIDSTFKKLPAKTCSTSKDKSVRHVKNNTLTSFCILSHHPFFSMFRECLFLLKQIIESCSERSSCHRVGGSKNSGRDTVWGVLTGHVTDNCPNLIMHEVREIETWIFRLLSAPVPVPSKTRVEVKVLPLRHHNPLVFAMPDHTRFSLVDFPLHLPLELLGIDSCLKVLTLIMLENKIMLQSRDYNALSMSVMAFVAMLYPLEYMFPVIPLLPTCMSNAEQLLLVPTPFIIGVPTSFLMYKKNFQLPDDVWLIDLDSNKLVSPTHVEEIPDLPEPEGSVLKNHLKQALTSMSVSPQPIKDIDKLKSPLEFFTDLVDPAFSNNGFNPLIYGNDVDSVDVATRVAMVRFFNSPNILGNFAEHTRTLRLFPRPVVAFQLISFLRSRPIKTKFTSRLAKTQAVEYFVEWALNPTNAVFLRVQTGIFDPLLIGDKPKWFSNSLQKVEFSVYDDASTLASALEHLQAKHLNDSNPTDESGSDSDGAESTSSSYSSLSDFVTDIQNSDINGDTPSHNPSEKQVLAVDESKVFQPPSELQVPDEMNLAHAETKGHNEESDENDDDSSDASCCNEEFNTVMQQEKLKTGDEDLSNRIAKEAKNINLEHNEPTIHKGAAKDAQKSKVPPKRPPPPNPAFLNRMSSLPPSSTQPLTKSTTKQTSLPQQKTFTSQFDTSDKTSIINSFTGEINNYAQSASITITELLGDAFKLKIDNFPNIASSVTSTLVESDQSPSSSFCVKTSKAFTPLGNKKALIEKSVLVKHANIHRKSKPLTKQQSVLEQKNVQHSENQQFLKEVSQAVLEGRGIGWLKMGRVKKLMEDENYRNFVVSRLNTSLEKKLSDESQHLEDVCISKQVFKGMLTMLKALICGLEVTYQNQGTGGVASAMMVLEIGHTHYWEREGSSKSDTSNQSLASSPFGSNEALSTVSDAKTENKEEAPVATLGSPVVVNGDEFETIELHQDGMDVRKTLKVKPGGQGKVKSDVDNNNVEDNKGAIGVQSAMYIDKQRDSSGYASESGDMLRELVKNKELLEMTKTKNLIKTNSLESDVSDFSLNANTTKRKRSNSSFLSSKSHLSGGYRYREGRMHNLNFPQQECTRNYLFEMLIGKDRSNLWDQIQFWEDVFLDAVAQERDIVGMDQGPNEMMERYKSLNDSEKKRLECDEDHLLGCMLYNMISFMVMMAVNKNEIKRKVRRLLGKCHIGLSCSYDINQLLDQIESLVGNDIDLKPLGSRLMQKQSFTVHWGPDNTGDMLFMEVCDDCLILRSVNGAICDRWWYEKLVNMTYCPKTKVFCLWRKHDGQTQLNKFYTKKCKELYNCVKTSMEKAASKNNGKIPGLELGSEFPVHDLKSGQGGLLQVCMEGIGLLFANSKLFIELCHIKKCFTVKGGIFVLEEFDPKSRKIVQRRYKSSMAAQICYAVLCIFSYVAAGMDHKTKASVQYNAVDNRPVTISILGSKSL